MPEDFVTSCPVADQHNPQILLAHGGGGRLMHQLIEQVFMPAFGNAHLAARHDGAVLEFGDTRLAFATDSYVVRPLFFPGGDIGSLAVNGTTNDLAMCGARPLYLSASLILEEGLLVSDLRRIVASMRQAADAVGVQFVTGDTKVVDHGKGDGVYINTTGIGVLEHSLNISPASVRPGDAILLNGDIGRHGIAIMAQREGLKFESTIESDTAPLADCVARLISGGVEVHCLRDLTRGGLASGLVEIAEAAGLHLGIDETRLPVHDAVRGACEILGLDPMYVANEGRFIAFVPQRDLPLALDIMGLDSCLLGCVTEAPSGCVTMKSLIGTNRIVQMMSGEQLPRIC